MATWLLVAPSGGFTDADGAFYPAGSRVGRIVYDGITPYEPPDGLALQADADGDTLTGADGEHLAGVDGAILTDALPPTNPAGPVA